jgi:hypothetical protein
MRRSLRTIALCTLVSGCYNYAPLELSSATPGTNVRARLTAPAGARIATSLGNGDARLLTGVVVDAESSGFTLEVPTVPVGTASAQQGLFQRVTIASGDILELERRVIDKQRTGVVVGAAVAAAGIITAAIIHGQSTGSNATTEPPPNFIRILVGAFRF